MSVSRNCDLYKYCKMRPHPSFFQKDIMLEYLVFYVVKNITPFINMQKGVRFVIELYGRLLNMQMSAYRIHKDSSVLEMIIKPK